MSVEKRSAAVINSVRFHDDLDALARVGGTAEGGVNRPAFSENHSAARQWFLERAQKAGLTTSIDCAGNHSALLPQPGAEKTLVIGSHLDSVPNGGRFDGALGVVAALEVLRAIKDADCKLAVNLEAIDFTDEECFYAEYIGSKAFSGKLKLEHLQTPFVDHFSEALAENGLKEEEMVSCGRNPDAIAGYLELHIEQGPRLEKSGNDIGIVSSIVGIRTNRTIFTGRSDHSGTTPIDLRLDAFLGAAAYKLAMQELLTTDFVDCVANIGNMDLSPGALNVVPEKAVLHVEIRYPREERGEAFSQALRERASEVANRYGLKVEINPTGYSEAVQLDPVFQEAAASAAKQLGLRALNMPSGAGHDAQVMASFTPTGLLFVPSVAGVSHNPLEFTKKTDCENGAAMLLQIVLNQFGI